MSNNLNIASEIFKLLNNEYPIFNRRVDISQYVIPNISSSTLTLSGNTNSNLLHFKLNNSVNGNIKLSIIGLNTNNYKVYDIEGSEVINLSSGYYDVIVSSDYFVILNRDGLTQSQLSNYNLIDEVIRDLSNLNRNFEFNGIIKNSITEDKLSPSLRNKINSSGGSDTDITVNGISPDIFGNIELDLKSNEFVAHENNETNQLHISAVQNIPSNLEGYGILIKSDGEFVDVPESNVNLNVILDEIDNLNNSVEQIENKLDGIISLPVNNEVSAHITVKSQSDCDNLLSNMRNINSNVINVAFNGGTYFVNNLLIGSDFNGKEINLYNVSGEEVIILPSSDKYTPKEAIETTSTHYICNAKSPYLGNNTLISDIGIINVCDSRNVTNNTLYRNNQDNVEEVDSNNKIYRIKMSPDLERLNNIDTNSFKSLFLWSAYLMFPNEITKIENGFVYFRNLRYTHVNLDRTYMNTSNRYYLTNIEEYLTSNTFLVKDDKIYIPKKCKYAILAKSNNSIVIQNSTAKVNIIGLSFSGGYNEYTDIYDSIIKIHDSKNINIMDCNFNNVECQSIYITSSGNGSSTPYTTKDISIVNCNFKNTGNGCIDFLGENVSIEKCNFEYIGMFRKGCEVIFGGGKNFYVANNNLHHFPYVGIRAGKTRVLSDHNSGIFENNIVNGGLNKVKDEYMADGGGIYVFTYNVDVIVRDNVIFNMSGHDMRGIMGDDGNNNTKYIRNLIFNINGLVAHKGIDCFNVFAGSQSNHLNNQFINNIVIGASINFTASNTSNTKTYENVITTKSTHRGTGIIIDKPDYDLLYYRTDNTCAYLDKNINLPFDIPEIFYSYLKFEDPILMSSNQGNVPVLLNSTNYEINQSNTLAPNLFTLQKYGTMNMNAQMIRGFSYSQLGLYSNLNIQIPWDIENKTGNCFINFKVNLFSDRKIYRNSFEVTFNAFKPDVSTYQNLLFEVTNVSPKGNSSDISLKVTGYTDDLGHLCLLLEPLITGADFFNTTLMFIEITDVKVSSQKTLLTSKGEISINKTSPQTSKILGTFGVLSDKATVAHLKVTDVIYPENTMVFLTDTNQLVIRKNNNWLIQSTSILP